MESLVVEVVKKNEWNKDLLLQWEICINNFLAFFLLWQMNTLYSTFTHITKKNQDTERNETEENCLIKRQKGTQMQVMTLIELELTHRCTPDSY